MQPDNQRLDSPCSIWLVFVMASAHNDHERSPLPSSSQTGLLSSTNIQTGRRRSAFSLTLLNLLLLCTHQAAEAAGDPTGKDNLAGSSTLPQSDGIASSFAGDSNITSHPAVIFADNFELGRLGEHWDSERNDAGAVLALVPPQDNDRRLGSRILRVTATLGTNTGGGLTKWFESSDRLFIRFMVQFDQECDYVHHFCTLRANRGLLGKDRWSGFGGAGLRPTGDERFSTALEPWGNWAKWPAPGQWNFYSYWHEMDASPDGKFWGNAFRPIAQPNIAKGTWINCEFMLKHNAPGKRDGEQAFWIDGQLRGHWNQISWRTTDKLQANAFTLESYVTDRWTAHKVNIVEFDNVVIAREYIGPVAPVAHEPLF